MESAISAELPRELEKQVLRRMAASPVVVIHGPRTAGKSTVLRRLGARLDATPVNLDDPATRAAAVADPSLFASAAGPILIDEYQRAPDLLDAIKAEVDRDFRPGRFVVTGSTNYSTIPRASQSLTGRAEVLTLWPLSQGELMGRQEGFAARLMDDPASWRGTSSTTTRAEYHARVLAGGMPIALRRAPGTERRRWFQSYLDLVVTRDVLDIRQVRQRDVLPALLRALVGQTGQLLNIANAAQRVGINRDVGGDYLQLLEAVFLVRRLEAWGRTLNARVTTSPKVHALDSGVGGWLLGLTEDRLATLDPTALEQFGHLLETFATHEILKQVSWMDEPPSAGHYRTKDGTEVDLVLERFDGRVCGVEIKSGTVVGPRDGRGLAALRDRLGSQFLGGVVLYLGERGVELGDRIHAVPMDRLWHRVT